MARVKIRIEVNKGRKGAPLSKLGRLAGQLERVLSLVAGDCSFHAKEGEWIALNFKNGSVSYDAEFQGEVDFVEAQAFYDAIDHLTDYNRNGLPKRPRLSERTVIEYAKLGRLIDPDETFSIGLYPPGQIQSLAPVWKEVAYSQLAELRDEIGGGLTVYGGLQGIIHSWFKEATPPYFRLRELSTRSLINCYYPTSLYDAVAKAIKEKKAVLLLDGRLDFDPEDRSLKSANVEKIVVVESLTAEEFDNLFGSAPAFTGAETTDDFMERMRDDD